MFVAEWKGCLGSLISDLSLLNPAAKHSYAVRSHFCLRGWELSAECGTWSLLWFVADVTTAYTVDRLIWKTTRSDFYCIRKDYFTAVFSNVLLTYSLAVVVLLITCPSSVELLHLLYCGVVDVSFCNTTVKSKTNKQKRKERKLKTSNWMKPNWWWDCELWSSSKNVQLHLDNWFFYSNIKNYKGTYGGSRKYSDPLHVFTICYFAALC